MSSDVNSDNILKNNETDIPIDHNLLNKININIPRVISNTSDIIEDKNKNSENLMKNSINDYYNLQTNQLTPKTINGKEIIEVKDIIGEEANQAINLQILSKKFKNFGPGKISTKVFGHIQAYAANTNQGIIRNYNEDRVSIVINMNKPSGFNPSFNWPKISYFGIFDGHAGYKCAEFLRDNLLRLICLDPNFNDDKVKAIKQGFLKAEEEYLEKHAVSENQIIDNSGSCALILLIIDNFLYIANVGDSRCLVSMKNGLIQRDVTRDHKPNYPYEKERIEANGGKIYLSQTPININFPEQNGNYKEKLLIGPYRVLPGRLSVSRTIGDAEAKIQKFGGNPKVIVPIADVYQFDLTKDDIDFFILACDGVYDQMASTDVFKCVWLVLDNFLEASKLNNNNGINSNGMFNKSIGDSVDLILKSAMARKSFDNVTCLLIAFKNLYDKKKEYNDNIINNNSNNSVYYKIKNVNSHNKNDNSNNNNENIKNKENLTSNLEGINLYYNSKINLRGFDEENKKENDNNLNNEENKNNINNINNNNNLNNEENKNNNNNNNNINSINNKNSADIPTNKNTEKEENEENEESKNIQNKESNNTETNKSLSKTKGNQCEKSQTINELTHNSTLKSIDSDNIKFDKANKTDINDNSIAKNNPINNMHKNNQSLMENCNNQLTNQRNSSNKNSTNIIRHYKITSQSLHHTARNIEKLAHKKIIRKNSEDYTLSYQKSLAQNHKNFNETNNTNSTMANNTNIMNTRQPRILQNETYDYQSQINQKKNNLKSNNDEFKKLTSNRLKINNFSSNPANNNMQYFNNSNQDILSIKDKYSRHFKPLTLDNNSNITNIQNNSNECKIYNYCNHIGNKNSCGLNIKFHSGNLGSNLNLKEIKSMNINSKIINDKDKFTNKNESNTSTPDVLPEVKMGNYCQPKIKRQSQTNQIQNKINKKYFLYGTDKKKENNSGFRVLSQQKNSSELITNSKINYLPKFNGSQNMNIYANVNKMYDNLNVNNMIVSSNNLPSNSKSFQKNAMSSHPTLKKKDKTESNFDDLDMKKDRTEKIFLKSNIHTPEKYNESIKIKLDSIPLLNNQRKRHQLDIRKKENFKLKMNSYDN